MPMRPAAAPPRRPHGARLLGKVPDRVLRAGRRDRPIAQLPPLGLRVAGLAAVAVIVFAVILFRLWFLQILTGQQYVAAANNNRLRAITVPAPRGVIVDSKGKILVDNRPALAVGLRLMDVPQGQLRDEVSRLSLFVGTSQASLREYVARHAGPGLIVLAQGADDAAISALRAESLPGVYIKNGAVANDGTVGLALNGVIQNGKRIVAALPDGQMDRVIARLSDALHSSPAQLYESFVRQASRAYDVVIAKEDVKQGAVNRVQEHLASFPGVIVRTDYLRAYPQVALAEHILGSVGPVTADELKLSHFAGLPDTAITGQGGVEYTYDQWLRGSDGQYKIEVDSMGRPKNTPIAGGKSAVPGDTLQLSIDARVQKAAEEALVTGIETAHLNHMWKANGGAAVVMDVKTGEIIAMASNPTYDPTIFQSGTRKQWKQVSATGANTPLMNRAEQGLYPGGSAFKPVTAVAALENGVVTKYSTFFCNGAFKKFKQVFKCWSYPSGHGNANMEQALMESCDVYFYNLGFLFNGRKGTELEDWASRLGFGRKTGIDVPGEASGLVPTPAWKQKHFKIGTWDYDWHPGDSIQLAIGQSYLLVSPLQMAVAYAAVANGGRIVTPHVGVSIKDAAGRLVQRVATETPRGLDISQGTLDTVREGLKLAANATNGTSAPVFSGYPVMVAGKTGTAEQPPKDPTAWYASFAPANDPKYVVVVVIEQGGHGGAAAAPAAKLIYNALFNIKGGSATGATRSD
jgi:penicillin-binding protein 2